MRTVLIPAFAMLGASCSSSDSGGPGLDRFNELQLLLSRTRPHVAEVSLARAIDGQKECLVAGDAAGATYGGLPMAMKSPGERQSDGTCTPVTFQVDLDSGSLTSDDVEIHDSTRQVSVTFPKAALGDRAMSLAGVTMASAGDVVHVGWEPVSDLVQGRPVEVLFELPGGAMWRAPVSIGLMDLSFTAQSGATGSGTLSVLWGDLLTGPATSCELVLCSYQIKFNDSLPFAMQ
ncbi:MAG TPA: hypothetical protein VFT22_28430 [Kofleriaceae bacterium]|nr:hypothetical protein [Kofleriaceae bacterium]